VAIQLIFADEDLQRNGQG